MRKVVYTAVMGESKDSYVLYNPLTKSDGWDYICFTDNKIVNSDIWKVQTVSPSQTHPDPTKAARCIKILNEEFLADYDMSLWVDSRTLIGCDLNWFVEKYLTDDTDIVVMKHPERECIYSEAKAAIRLNKSSDQIIDSQINKYKQQGFPENFGLVATTYLLRRHHVPYQTAFMEKWWTEVHNGSGRDQLSFNYVLWKNPLKIKYTSWENHLQIAYVFLGNYGANYHEWGR